MAQDDDLLKDFHPEGADRWSVRGEERPDEPEKPWSEGALELMKIVEDGLMNDAVTEIHGYAYNKVGARYQGENSILLGKSFADEEEYERFLRKLVDDAKAATTWKDIERERQGVISMRNGERLSVFLPVLSQPWPTFSIRKHTAATWEALRFVENGTLDKRMMDFLQAAVAARVNILIVGMMGSGKTSLLRTLAQAAFGDNERIAVVEQVPELYLTKPLAMQYIYQPTVEGLGLADVLDGMLYHAIQRLVVGEVHLAGLTKMLETFILSEGGLSTYHAQSAAQAGERMKVALQMENPNMTAETAASFIRQAVELVVVLDVVEGQHRCIEITEVDWRSSGGASQLTGRTLFQFDRKDSVFRGLSRPDEDGRIVHKARHKYGIELPQHWFVDPEELSKLYN